MDGNTTSNTTNLIRAEVYSKTILDSVHDGALPVEMARDVTEFQDGTTFNVPTLGDFVIRDLDPEEQDIPIDTLDTGNLTLTINRFRGNGASLTDSQQEDSHLAAEFDAMFPMKQLDALRRSFETDMLAQVNVALPAGDVNTINSLHHRFIGSGANQTFNIEDIAYAKAAFDKAELSDNGRILVVDPIAELSLNAIANIVNVSNNPMFEGLVNTGFSRERRFMFNIFGFDVWVSNRLPQTATGEVLDASGEVAAPSGNATAATAMVANQFMAMSDPTMAPYMYAWRRQPRVRTERQEGKERDVFYTTSRYGIGTQRKQSVLTVLTNATAYK